MPPSSSSSNRTIRFISVSNPSTSKHASAHRSAIQSHAARIAHARVRHARTIEYQAANAATTLQQIQRLTEDKLGTQSSQTEPDARNTAGEQSEVVRETREGDVAGHRPVLGGLGSGRQDLFTSFVRPFKPIEHFLLDHYVTTVAPYLTSQCVILGTCGPSIDGMILGWVRLGLSDSGFLNGIFLNASRHLSKLAQHHQRLHFSHLATWYKLACLRTVNDAINSRSGNMLFGDSVIGQVMMMALDEITSGDLTTARRHVQGAFTMVDLNGGPQTLGLDGFLETVLQKYRDQVGLRPHRVAT